MGITSSLRKKLIFVNYVITYKCKTVKSHLLGNIPETEGICIGLCDINYFLYRQQILFLNSAIDILLKRTGDEFCFGCDVGRKTCRQVESKLFVGKMLHTFNGFFVPGRVAGIGTCYIESYLLTEFPFLMT